MKNNKYTPNCPFQIEKIFKFKKGFSSLPAASGSNEATEIK